MRHVLRAAVGQLRQTLGDVAAVWRFPVKSMAGEQLPEVAVTAGGLVGDRAFGLIDLETGKVVSAKSMKRFPTILLCRAEFTEQPEIGEPSPPVRITFPDGESVTSDSVECDEVLTRFFQRRVTLTSVAPEDFTIDQYHPNIRDADPSGYRDTVVDLKLGSALFAEMGVPSPVSVGAFFDVFPISLMSTSALATLQELQPGSRFDTRRFRMNLIIATGGEGFVENEWLGTTVRLGDGPRVRVTMPDPRCVMPVLPQHDLPRDDDVLRTLIRHNRLEIEGAGRYPCAGVYGTVEQFGHVRVGDPVTTA